MPTGRGSGRAPCISESRKAAPRGGLFMFDEPDFANDPACRVAAGWRRNVRGSHGDWMTRRGTEEFRADMEKAAPRGRPFRQSDTRLHLLRDRPRDALGRLRFRVRPSCAHAPRCGAGARLAARERAEGAAKDASDIHDCLLSEIVVISEQTRGSPDSFRRTSRARRMDVCWTYAASRPAARCIGRVRAAYARCTRDPDGQGWYDLSYRQGYVTSIDPLSFPHGLQRTRSWPTSPRCCNSANRLKLQEISRWPTAP